MSTTFEETFPNTVREDMIYLLEPELNTWESSVHEIKLSRSGISKLVGSICNLPHTGQEILLGTYAFGLTPENIEILYGITNADLRRKFFEKILAKEIGLNDTECIAKSSLYKACRSVMIRLSKYSDTSQKNNNVIHIFARTAAAILIVSLLSFGTAMGVNAEFREAVTKWFIETLSTYSIFRFENNLMTDTALEDYKITYIPTGFTYTGVDKNTNIISYTYEDSAGNYLSVDIEHPGENNYIDTENTDMELLHFNGSDAWYYYKDDYSMLVTTIDGYALFISGPVSQEEIMKIAYGIRR